MKTLFSSKEEFLGEVRARTHMGTHQEAGLFETWPDGCPAPAQGAFSDVSRLRRHHRFEQPGWRQHPGPGVS